MTGHTHGYYWVLRGNDPRPQIAKLTKHGGWEYLDGSHKKMIKKFVKILKRVEDYVEEPREETHRALAATQGRSTVMDARSVIAVGDRVQSLITGNRGSITDIVFKQGDDGRTVMIDWDDVKKSRQLDILLDAVMWLGKP